MINFPSFTIMLNKASTIVNISAQKNATAQLHRHLEITLKPVVLVLHTVRVLDLWLSKSSLVAAVHLQYICKQIRRNDLLTLTGPELREETTQAGKNWMIMCDHCETLVYNVKMFLSLKLNHFICPKFTTFSPLLLQLCFVFVWINYWDRQPIKKHKQGTV